MKRDHRLRALSSEHHHALVLARSVSRRASAWSIEAGAELARAFADELAPHFAVEEDLLLPALRGAGAGDLAEHIRETHMALRALALDAAGGDGEAAAMFAAQLTAHIRFEERELFPACEQLLSDEVLDRVAARGR